MYNQQIQNIISIKKSCSKTEGIIQYISYHTLIQFWQSLESSKLEDLCVIEDTVKIEDFYYISLQLSKHLESSKNLKGNFIQLRELPCLNQNSTRQQIIFNSNMIELLEDNFKNFINLIIIDLTPQDQDKEKSDGAFQYAKLKIKKHEIKNLIKVLYSLNQNYCSGFKYISQLEQTNYYYQLFKLFYGCHTDQMQQNDKYLCQFKSIILTIATLFEDKIIEFYIKNTPNNIKGYFFQDIDINNQLFIKFSEVDQNHYIDNKELMNFPEKQYQPVICEEEQIMLNYKSFQNQLINYQQQQQYYYANQYYSCQLTYESPQYSDVLPSIKQQIYSVSDLNTPNNKKKQNYMKQNKKENQQQTPKNNQKKCSEEMFYLYIQSHKDYKHNFYKISTNNTNTNTKRMKHANGMSKLTQLQNNIENYCL